MINSEESDQFNRERILKIIHSSPQLQTWHQHFDGKVSHPDPDPRSHPSKVHGDQVAVSEKGALDRHRGEPSTSGDMVPWKLWMVCPWKNCYCFHDFILVDLAFFKFWIIAPCDTFLARNNSWESILRHVTSRNKPLDCGAASRQTIPRNCVSTNKRSLTTCGKAYHAFSGEKTWGQG